MTHHLPWHHPRRWGSAALVWALMAQMAVPAHAFVSQLPVAFTAPPDPNVMFTLDDSGSMHADVIPDLPDAAGLPAGVDSWPVMWSSGTGFLNIAYYTNSNATPQNVAGRYLRSADGNPIYYNPKVRYRPWPNPLNDRLNPTITAPGYLADANPIAVNIHPSDPSNSTNVIDITKQMGSPAFWPATYFIKTSAAPLPLAQPAGPASTTATFEMVEIRPDVATYPKRFVAPEADLRSDCAAASVCTYAEELQNFANWLQYYRSRMLMAKGGASAAFARQSTNLRVGFGTIKGIRNGVRTFDGSDRTNFYNSLYATVPNGGTPLRTTTQNVGEYFKGTGVDNPWAENPGISIGTEYSCRRSFHILSTDGFWNQAFNTPVGNADDFTGEYTPKKPDNVTKYPFADAAGSLWSVSPYADTVSNTLSDVTAVYWMTDLRPDLPNNVIPSSRDPAFWQHLTMYTIGFGIGGTGTVTKRSDGSVADLTTQASRDQLIRDQTPLNWPFVDQSLPTTGDDLIHAAMTGHGRYMSSTNPTDLANNLASALAEAVDNPGDLASVAVGSAQVQSGGTLYQATFSPARWYGRLYAFGQDGSTGKVNNTPTDASATNTNQLWEASNKMPAPALRNIFTSQGGAGTGALFTWGSLSAGQQANLANDPTLLDYLRGDATHEMANGGNFRDRSRYTVGTVTGGVLGDIIGGSPLKGPDAGGGYDRLPTTTASTEQSSYATFRSASGPLADMINTIFLGANDGMLHAFSLTDGVERFGYVPSTVYNVPRSTAGGLDEQKLRLLASPDYTHRFTVDGPPNVADAFIGGQWRSLLVGTTGAGARGLFVMDVTKPNAGTGDFDISKLLWELSEGTNTTLLQSPDMGFVLGYPHVVRMRNGAWAVISGNGYESASGNAVLYIRDAQTGAVIKDFTVDSTGGNGLSQPNFILNAQREVIAIYAGDLKGNLWKFDVSGTSTASWAPAFGTAPLFTAIGPTGVAQPITVMPEISAHPSGGAMVIFGTGKLYDPNDTKNDPTLNVNLKGQQSLYGIWDKPAATTGITVTTTTRTTLLQPQTLLPVVAADSASYRRTSTQLPNWTTQRGWVIDLDANGERDNLPAQQFRQVIFMATNTPNPADPCASSGTSKIFALDPVTGAAPSFPVFDANGDGIFNPPDKGLNVLINNSALLTQPVFQVFSGGGTATTPMPTVQPIAALDRGQATAARSGGVELSRASGSKSSATSAGGGGDPGCKGLMSAAKSNTDLLQQLINGCSSKTRISWRQLK